MRKLILVATLAALPFISQAQTVTCQQNDTTCRVLHNDLAAILQQLKAGVPATGIADGTTTPPTGTTTTPVVTPTPTPTPTPVAGQVAALTVGPGQAIMEPADAIGNMLPGGVMTVLPGTYTKAFSMGVDNLTIKCSVAGKCVMDGGGGAGGGHRLAWGKGCHHVYNASVTFIGFHYIRCGSPQSGNSYSNEAAIYYENDDGKPHTIKAIQDIFDNNANGLDSSSVDGFIVVDTSVFGLSAPNGMNGYTNGSANGPAHDMYMRAHSLEVKGSFFYGGPGHNVKFRGDILNVHDNPVMTMDGGRTVEGTDGGQISIVNNVMWSGRVDAVFPPRTIQGGLKGGLFGNSNLIGYADESATYGSPGGLMTGNTIHISRTSSKIWVAAGALTASANTLNFYGSGSLDIQGTVNGLGGGSAVPGAAANPPAPPVPSWYTP